MHRTSGPKSRTKPAMAVALEALSLAKGMRKLVEAKVYQEQKTITNLLAGVITDFSAIPQGVTVSQRVGETIRLQRLRVRAKMGMTTSSNMAYRCIVFADKRQQNSVAPLVAQVLVSDLTVSPYLIDNNDRWLILKDETIELNATFLNGDQSHSIIWDIDCRNLPMDFAFGAGHSKNGVYMLLTADVLDTSGGGTKPAIADSVAQFFWEAVFTDA
jgi:hypothetical protein